MFWYELYPVIKILLIFVAAILALSPAYLISAVLHMFATICTIYKFCFKLIGREFPDERWEPLRSLFKVAWNSFSRIWHGYEVDGLENVPDEGPGLFVLYHGTVSIDYYHLATAVRIHNKRQLGCIVNRWFFKIPCFRAFAEVMGFYSGDMEECVNLLKEGKIIVVYPGGALETLFSDDNYSLVWGQRKGFAKLALEAKVPIIPAFTRNIQQAFWTPRFGRRVFQYLYEKKILRQPLFPVLGAFPIILKTYVGKPIPYDPNLTPEELAEKVSASMRIMIAKHQPRPGSIMRAMSERFFPTLWEKKLS